MTTHQNQESVAPIKCLGFSTAQDRFVCSKPVQSLTVALNTSMLSLPVWRQEALARVVPLLVCGEQSAVAVFGNASEINHRAAQKMKAAFHRIESEEAGHEVLWQTLFAILPEPADRHALQRRAARFFARLGRADNVRDHFAQISQLDSMVGTIMWYLQRSAVAADPRVATLANHIKQDEARHVGVARQFARSLGLLQDRYLDLGAKIRAELIALLGSEADALESIGIDPDHLFQQLSRFGQHKL